MIYPQSNNELLSSLESTPQDQAISLASPSIMTCSCQGPESPTHSEISKAFMREYLSQNYVTYKPAKDTEKFNLEVLNELNKTRTVKGHRLSRAVPLVTSKPEVNCEIKQFNTKEKTNKTTMTKAKKVLWSFLPAFKRSIFTKIIDYESNSSEIVHLQDFGVEWCQVFKEMRCAEWEHFKYLTKDQHFC
ncbi:hypothetical protein WICPIJ_000929 [Wickerhamomyces pijperi]|uniref:Uncharacterized protein n=1 Tax=Wickerhamomyces pijperi TaxID=599730 RepID=A0A9P8QCJ1_WICPI|nr:hypothetical protein WICPIJ_000929 [Wickerhamomyces pijperi]